MPYQIPANHSPSQCNVHVGALPPYISPSQPPTKRQPWRTIQQVDLVSSVSISLPEELYAAVWDGVFGSTRNLECKWAKVLMKLEDVLSGEFFTEYIKRGNILLLSEGDPGSDDFFWLKDGTLRLCLSKETYERTGLSGEPIRSGSRKHVKQRYLIEVNLRLPSMLHGKKGFERLVWAAKNILNRSLCWLFADMDQWKERTKERSEPIRNFHPTWEFLSPSSQLMENVLVPSSLATPVDLQPPGAMSHTFEVLQESLHDMLEYLDLLALGSQRVQTTDNVDPFISRYKVPDLAAEDSVPGPTGHAIRIMKWQGLIPARWILELLVGLIQTSRNVTSNPSIANDLCWLSMSVTAHRTQAIGQPDGYTLVLQPHNPIQSSNGPELQRIEVGNSKPQQDEMDIDIIHDHSPVLPHPQDARDLSACTAENLQGPGFQHYLLAEYVDSTTYP